MASTKTKKKSRNNHQEPSSVNYDYLKLNAKKEEPAPVSAPAIIPEKTQPLDVTKPQPKPRFTLFHRNGKKTKMLRALCFTLVPYGFKEDTIEESRLKAAHITPVKDDQGDIYIVVKTIDANGAEALSKWPEGIAFPAVPSAKLGRARNWDMIQRIAKSEKPSWMKAFSLMGWGIVIAVLILIFFLGYFFIMGGSK